MLKPPQKLEFKEILTPDNRPLKVRVERMLPGEDLGEPNLGGKYSAADRDRRRRAWEAANRLRNRATFILWHRMLGRTYCLI